MATADAAAAFGLPAAAGGAAGASADRTAARRFTAGGTIWDLNRTAGCGQLQFVGGQRQRTQRRPAASVGRLSIWIRSGLKCGRRGASCPARKKINFSRSDLNFIFDEKKLLKKF